MAMSEEISLKQLQEFHNIDRKAFSRLVIDQSFDPFPSMKIVAFWNFLERTGFKHFVYNLQKIPDPLLVSLAQESTLCLDFLYSSSTHHEIMDFPVMKKLVSQDISLDNLFKNRESAKRMIEDLVEDVCKTGFSDIVETYLGSKKSSTPPSNDTVMENKGGVVHRTDRTLFLTFSRGHPVSNQELHGFIVREFGKHCLEAINMDKKYPNPLFACVVLRSLSDMSRILGGEKSVNFFINGKQVRARRFVPKSVKQQSRQHVFLSKCLCRSS